MTAARCPLCRSADARPFAEVRSCRYFRCGLCLLTWLSPEQRPTREQERLRYASHRNDPGDPRYRAFLGRLTAPLVPRLAPGAEGLDYGSGPGPTLSVMLEERGFQVALYDPFFAPDPGPLHRTYDFITCSETAEHFFSPAEEFEQLDRLLRPGGWLGLMTRWLGDEQPFASWHYARDPTHVCFYQRATLDWIAGRHRWTLHVPQPDVALFQKVARP